MKLKKFMKKKTKKAIRPLTKYVPECEPGAPENWRDGKAAFGSDRCAVTGSEKRPIILFESSRYNAGKPMWVSMDIVSDLISRRPIGEIVAKHHKPAKVKRRLPKVKR